MRRKRIAGSDAKEHEARLLFRRKLNNMTVNFQPDPGKFDQIAWMLACAGTVILVISTILILAL